MAAPTTIALLVVVVLVVAADTELPRLEHPPRKEDRSLTLLAVGDWGRRGQFNQSLVAEQVRIRARSCPHARVHDHFYFFLFLFFLTHMLTMSSIIIQ